MIPKVIHYCWLGGEQPKLVKKCIASWQEKCPDYEIKCWNEENFDLSISPYAMEAYNEKKYAFVSDFMRMYVLYNYGGIYIDTDLELLKPFDQSMLDKPFTCFESDQYVGAGIVATEPQNPFIKELLDYYDGRHFVNADGTFDNISIPKPFTKILVEKHNLQLKNEKQELEHITVYPSDYFYPYDNATGVKRITDNTYGVHWYSKSWLPKHEILISNITRIFHRIFGVDCFKHLNKLLNRE